MPGTRRDGTILVTGAAGFIGMHVVKALLARGERVLGVDNLNDYYDPALKRARLTHIGEHTHFSFLQGDIADPQVLTDAFTQHQPTSVIHLAAQAGVRYSLEKPEVYIQSNIVGFANLLECCRHHATTHLVYASSSSVYGNNRKLPFAEADNVDHPVSLYAATKKSNELMAHTYSHLFQLPVTGLRFFTVYGPWGRPDMSPWLFTSAILEGRPLKVFNHGHMERDFTYIDDITEGVLRTLDLPPTRGTSTDTEAPYRLFNIGNNNPVKLLDYIKTIETCTGKQAQLELHPMQAGDMQSTYADISAIEQATGFRPSTPLAEGIEKWVAWYRAYHALQETPPG